MEMRLTTQMATSQTEVVRLKPEIEALRKQQELTEDARRHDAAEHDRELMAKIRLAVQTTIEEYTRQKRHKWWSPWGH